MTPRLRVFHSTFMIHVIDFSIIFTIYLGESYQIMDHSDLIELRNKLIHLYQAVVMIESGECDLKSSLTLMKNTSKSIVDLLDNEFYDREEAVTPVIEDHNVVFGDSLFQNMMNFRDVESFFTPLGDDPLIPTSKKVSSQL
jgi:hypothetical protein